MRKLFLVLAALAAVSLLGSWVAEQQYAGRAKLIQLVRVDAAGAELFAEEPVPIGSAALYVLEPSDAFLGKQNEAGAELVDEQKLKAANIYPLQLQTVRFFATNVRWASALALLLFAGLAWWKRPRKA